VARLDGRPVRLSLRHAEMLTLLAALCAGRLPPPEVLRHGDSEAVWAPARTETGAEDPELAARLRRLLPITDPRRDEIGARA